MQRAKQASVEYVEAELVQRLSIELFYAWAIYLCTYLEPLTETW